MKKWKYDFSTQQNMRDNIPEIYGYAFIAMAEKQDYQVAALWAKYFNNIDVKINGYTPIYIWDLAAITLKDYYKFFTKIRIQPYNKEELEQMICLKHYNYMDVWDHVASNLLPLQCNINNQIWLINELTLVIKKIYGVTRD